MKEFDFARNFKEAEKKHQLWWLSLSYAERWKANWEHVKLLYKSNPKLFLYSDTEANRYILSLLTEKNF